jgi:hypothetical protein
MHNTPFRVKRHCPDVDYMQTLSQNIFPQPWHPVPMSSLSVRFIAHALDDCIAIRNSQITAARMQNIKKILQHMDQNNYSETVFKYQTKGS